MAIDSTGTYMAVYNNDKLIRIKDINNEGRVVAKINLPE